MKRKITYSLLALPWVLFFAYFVTLPSITRKAFISEFRHRTATLLGLNVEPSGGPRGLRLDRPEEYGMPAASANAHVEPNEADVEP